MGLKGDVRSMPLANVLQDLAMNEQTGTLLLRHRDRQVALWFEKGALRLVGLGPGQGPSPLNGLIALGKLPPEEASAGRGTNERSLLKSALRRKLITVDDARAGLEHQMAEHLCDAFLWPEATFEFTEGDPDDARFDTDQLDLEPRLAVDATIMEAVRRADEWRETRKAVLSSNEILVGDPTLLPADADGIVKRVLGLMDGERSLREIMEHTRLGQFAVLGAAARLLRCGAARPLSVADAAQRARARAGRKEWGAALKMALYGLDHERHNTGLLELALRCAEELGDAGAAAGYARRLAAAQVEQGALEAAIQSYQKVLAHAPNDLTARERLFDILIRLDLKLDALATGEALASAYKKGGLPDRALEVYQKLVATVGGHTELLESVAEIQRHLGDRKEAVGTYRKLLARALESKNDTAALEYCHAILKIEPRHEEARRLREQLESGEMERARRRRRTVKVLAGAAVLLGLLAAGAVYEGKARSAYQEVRLTLLDARESKRFPEALRIYDLLLEGHPWSLVAREIRPEREQIEDRFVQAELERSGAQAAGGRLAEAIAGLEKALPHVRSADRRGRIQARIVELRKQAAGVEEEWRRRIAALGPAEIEKVSDPMAVAALERCLTLESPAVRRAALKALGEIEGPHADEALLRALGHVDPAVKEEAAAHLARRHREDPATQAFGTDPIRWQEWWGRRESRPGRPPLQAALRASRQSFGPGEPVLVEWRIANLGAAETEFVLDEDPSTQLRVQGPGGTAAPLASPGAAPRRPVRLGPGQFLGGTFDLSAAMNAPGRYTLSWAVGLHWQNRPLPRIEAPPLLLERTP